MFSESILTLAETVKCSIHQFYKNEFDVSPLLLLSQKPIVIDYSLFDALVKTLADRIGSRLPIDVAEVSSVSSLIRALRSIKDAGLDDKSSKLLRDIAGESSLLDAESGFDELVSFFRSDVEVEIQRLFYMSVAERARTITGPVYSAHYYDFRGRVYPRSSVSFMYLKNIRPNFQAAVGPWDEASVRSSKYFKLIMGEELVLPHDISAAIKSDIDRYAAIVILIELGKLFKSSLISNHGATAQEFISLGGSAFVGD
jgi:hypothetical protein